MPRWCSSSSIMEQTRMPRRSVMEKHQCISHFVKASKGRSTQIVEQIITAGLNLYRSLLIVKIMPLMKLIRTLPNSEFLLSIRFFDTLELMSIYKTIKELHPSIVPTKGLKNAILLSRS